MAASDSGVFMFSGCRLSFQEPGVLEGRSEEGSELCQGPRRGNVKHMTVCPLLQDDSRLSPVVSGTMRSEQEFWWPPRVLEECRCSPCSSGDRYFGW